MMTSWMKHGLRLVGATALVVALSGCIVYPYGYGPRGGYYHPHYYYY
jgi:hypothetical protein